MPISMVKRLKNAETLQIPNPVKKDILTQLKNVFCKNFRGYR